MQNCVYRISFGTGCSERQLIGLGNVQSSAMRISFRTCGSEIDKNEEEILKIQEFFRYLVW